MKQAAQKRPGKQRNEQRREPIVLPERVAAPFPPYIDPAAGSSWMPGGMTNVYHSRSLTPAVYTAASSITKGE